MRFRTFASLSLLVAVGSGCKVTTTTGTPMPPPPPPPGDSGVRPDAIVVADAGPGDARPGDGPLADATGGDAATPREVTLAGSWTVGGAAPTAASCTARGIASVGVRFFDMGGASLGFGSEYVFPCAQGSFDDRMRAGGIPYGSYMSQLYAAASDGAVLQTGPMLALVLAAPTAHANLAPVDFTVMTGFNPRGTDFELTGEWTLNGAAPNGDACRRAGLGDVALVFAPETGTEPGVILAMAPCAMGRFDSGMMRIGRYGRYRTHYRVLRPDGTTLLESTPLPLVVEAPLTRAMLARAEFTYGSRLDVTLGWDTTIGPMMVDASCMDAGVATMSYALLRMGDGDVATGMMLPCAESLSFTGLAPGMYSLAMMGSAAMASDNWMVTCPGLDVSEPTEAYNCLIDRID